MHEELNEMLDELDAAMRLVQASVTRIREITSPTAEAMDESPEPGFLLSEQMKRARLGRANREFADFIDG